jgi:phage gp36-like protein
MAEQHRYADVEDLESPALGLPEKSFAKTTPDDRRKALNGATDLADSYLSKRFTLPIVEWRDDLRGAVTSIAAYTLLAGRGFNPQPGNADEQVRIRYEDAIRWLKDCSRNLANPAGIKDSTPEVDAGLVETETPIFSSNPRRGWGR